MKQRTQKRCFMIIALSLAVLLILSACKSQKIMFAGIDLTPWEASISDGIMPYIGLITCKGVEGGVGYTSSGELSGEWSRETLDILQKLELEKSNFELPTPPVIGEYFYQIRLNKLPEDAKPAYHIAFYSDFQYMVVYKGYDDQIGDTWEIQNPELIKDLFVKYEKYEMKL